MTQSKVSRRSFVKAAGAASAVALIARAGSALTTATHGQRGSNGEPEDLGPKLGVASYSLRNFSREQAIEMTKSLGVRYINFKSVHLPYNASQAEFTTARAELVAAGLELVGGGMI